MHCLFRSAPSPILSLSFSLFPFRFLLFLHPIPLPLFDFFYPLFPFLSSDLFPIVLLGGWWLSPSNSYSYLCPPLPSAFLLFVSCNHPDTELFATNFLIFHQRSSDSTSSSCHLSPPIISLSVRAGYADRASPPSVPIYPVLNDCSRCRPSRPSSAWVLRCESHHGTSILQFPGRLDWLYSFIPVAAGPEPSSLRLLHSRDRTIPR